MGHDWAHHGWLLFLKMKEKSQQEVIFFFSLLCTFFSTGGLTAMVVKECRLLSIALGCIWCLELLVAEDACTSRGGDQGWTDTGRPGFTGRGFVKDLLTHLNKISLLWLSEDAQFLKTLSEAFPPSRIQF